MKFATINYMGIEEPSIIYNDRIILLNSIMQSMQSDIVKDMNDFIVKQDDQMIETLRGFVKDLWEFGIPVNEVKIEAPIPEPNRNIICVGKNYIEHAREVKGHTANDDIPTVPIYFSKLVNRAIGTEDIINSHSDIVKDLDYEVELGIVIGKDGINIKEEEVNQYIFGYTIVNDISARDLQFRHQQWFRGKSLETFCAMGPYIVHKSEINPHILDIKCRVNDELRQSANTRDFIFGIESIICDLSAGMMLRAGDIIITGTPAGVGLGYNPPKYLKQGDEVQCYIDGIGYLNNKVE